MNTAWKLHIVQDALFTPYLCLICRYLIRPDPLSLVPNQGSGRKCSAGLAESHRFDTQDSTHLWETNKQTKKTNTLPERGETTTNLRHQEIVRWKAMQPDWPSYFLTLSELSSARCAWTFSITMGMFYLCTFLFSESWGHRSAFNEKLYVFISMYVHVLYCIMYVQVVCMCVLYVCASVNECVCLLMGQEQDTANFIWTAKGVCCQMKVKGCIFVSFSVS